MAMADLHTGQRLIGRSHEYVLKSMLKLSGKDVWQAKIEHKQSSTLQKEFAIIKIPRAENYSFLEAERSRLEILRGCPSIQQHIDDISEPKSIVLEYMPMSLENDIFKIYNYLERGEIKIVANRILQGLHFAHERGIIHGNMNPRNILFQFPETLGEGETMKVKIAQWANAIQTGGREMNYTTRAPYDAPESVCGQPWGTKANIWSFGTMIGSLIMRNKIFRSLIPNQIYRPFSVLRRHISNFGPLPEHMIQQAETRLNLTPGLLRSIEDGKLGLLKTREQFRDWRYYVQRGFILREVKKFVERVMKIDPKERPSAATLLEDEWLKDI